MAGAAQVEFISPTCAVLDAGLTVSIHHDAPVTFPNSMRAFDSAMSRTTRSGHLLGHDQRLTPMEALKAMTIWLAYQHFKEATKGSIAPANRPNSSC